MKIIFFGDSLTEGTPGASYFTILKEKLPEDSLVNAGRGGDTVISLYRRVKKMNMSKTFDIAILWVGVNDVLVHVSKKYPIIKLCCIQPWAKNIKDFDKHYRKLLEIVAGKARKTFTVSPLLIGENTDNKWNEKLGKLCTEIERLSAEYEHVEYIDLRKVFFSTLSSRKPSPFILNSIFRDVIGAWLLNYPKIVEWRSLERGLYLTFDGVHFNHAGAEMAADTFYRYITREKDLKDVVT